MRIKTFPLGAFWNQSLPSDWLQAGISSVPVSRESISYGGRPSLVHPVAPAQIELLEWQGALSHLEPWKRLARNAQEGNVFLEPGFALTAVQHEPVAHRPAFAFAWAGEGGAARDELLGLFAIHVPQRGGGNVARMWCSPMMALGAPLLDNRDGAIAVERLHRFLAESFQHVDGLILPQLALAGPVARTFLRHAAGKDLETRVFDRRQRAVVTSPDHGDDILKSFVSARKQKELRRQRRRLEDLGTLTYTSARTPEQIREAMERFLALEASGWKGNQSTALLSNPSTSTFARAMSRHFAQQKACWIDALELNGTPIAMGIVLVAGDTAFYWKTAYDERFARYSPGVLFSLDMTNRAIRSGTHELINSCAIPNHPMIDHIWRERVEMGDVMIQTLGSSKTAFALASSKELAKRRVRALAKSAYYAVIGKQPR